MLNQWLEEEKFPAMDAMYLVAISQCWVFGIYEILRTWRQLATEVVEHAEACGALGNDPEIASKIIALREKRSAKPSRPDTTEALHDKMYVDHLRRAESDPEWVQSIREAKEGLKPRKLEALRITLAKQEVPGAGKGSKAYMPAYTRGNQTTGSMMWLIEFKDGTSEFIDRQALADELGGLN